MFKDKIREECKRGGQCSFEYEFECCKEGVEIKLSLLKEKHIQEYMKDKSTTHNKNEDERAKTNVNLQHNLHNDIDRIKEKLYFFDTTNQKEGKTKDYVFAEHVRTFIKNVRYFANEIYLNNKQ